MDPDFTAGIAGLPVPRPRCHPAGQPDRMRQLQASIATRLELGDTLDTVERELIAPSGLPEEEQSALWLYAWSQPKWSPAAAPRRSVWSALGNGLLTLIGIYPHLSGPASASRVPDSLSTTADLRRHHNGKKGTSMTSSPASSRTQDQLDNPRARASPHTRHVASLPQPPAQRATDRQSPKRSGANSARHRSQGGRRNSPPSSQPRPRRWVLVQVWDGAVLASFDDETGARDSMTGADDD